MYLKKLDINSIIYPQCLHHQLTIFHQIELLQLYLPYIHIIGIFNDNDELIGIFYYFKKSKWGVSYIIPPPFVPNNGLVFHTSSEKSETIYSTIKELHHLIVNYFKDEEVANYIRFVLPPQWKDTQVFQWNQWNVKPNYTYQINLELSIDELYNNLSSEKRKSIRKSEKDGIIIKQEKNYDIVKTLVLKTFSRQKKKINTIYLEKILNNWANENNSFAYVAYLNNQPIATAFCVYDNSSAYYLFGGYDFENVHHGAGVTCMWQSILKSKELGLKVFDFEGSMLPNVEKYFRDFGGELVPYFVCEQKKGLMKFLL